VIRKVGVILLGVAVCLLGTTSALAMKYNYVENESSGRSASPGGGEIARGAQSS